MEREGVEDVESPAMDALIWALLPQELLDNILAALPVVQLFRLRTVCKRFRALIQSPSFLSLRTAMAPPEHWLLMFHLQGVAPWISAYDPRVKHWYNLPPCPLFVHYPYGLKEIYWFEDDYYLAAAEGLVCIPPMERTRPLVLLNPLTNMWRELPGMSIQGRMRVGLMVDCTTKAFVVVAVGLTEEPLITTDVFDSVEGFWKKPTHSLFPEWRLCDTGSLVYCNGCFYAIASYAPVADYMTSYDLLISYDLRQGVWKKTCDLPITGHLSDAMPLLFEVTRGRLFMFLVLNLSDEPSPFRLWELKQLEDAVEFIQVATSPQVIMEEMEGQEWVPSDFECHAIGNLVCFMAREWYRGLVYDLARDAWEWLPRHGVPGVDEQYFDHVVSCQPRLDMLST